LTFIGFLFIVAVMKIQAPKTFSTSRLALRKIFEKAAADIFSEYCTDPEVFKYTGQTPHKSLEITQKFLKRLEQDWDRCLSFTWFIYKKGRKKPIGAVGISNQGSTGSIFYMLSQRYWGKGYVAEAMQAIISWAFLHAGMEKIMGSCLVENQASVQVLRKLGMLPAGESKNQKGQLETNYFCTAKQWLNSGLSVKDVKFSRERIF
jgi:[ribosomal protein S5]-alanine N-acetyltransferase